MLTRKSFLPGTLCILSSFVHPVKQCDRGSSSHVFQDGLSVRIQRPLPARSKIETTNLRACLSRRFPHSREAWILLPSGTRSVSRIEQSTLIRPGHLALTLRLLRSSREVAISPLRTNDFKDNGHIPDG